MANLIHWNDAIWDPFPFDVVRNLMRWNSFADLAPAEPAATFVPAFDVTETKDGYLFTADLPGVKQGDLELSLTGNHLTISGKREQKGPDADGRWHACERNHGEFKRTFALPEGIDGEHVHAELKDGVLRVTVPKKPELRPRKIELS